MSMKLTRKVKGYFRKRKKDQCCQGVNPGEETGLMEARFSGGRVPGDGEIQPRTLELRAERAERPRNYGQAAQQTAPSLVSVFSKPGGAGARHSGGCLKSYWLTVVTGRGEHAPPTGQELRTWGVRPPMPSSGTVDCGEGESMRELQRKPCPQLSQASVWPDFSLMEYKRTQDK